MLVRRRIFPCKRRLKAAGYRGHNLPAQSNHRRAALPIAGNSLADQKMVTHEAFYPPLEDILAACIYYADIGMGIPKGVMHFIYIKTGPVFCVITQIDGDRVKSDTQNTRKGQQLYRGDFTPPR